MQQYARILIFKRYYSIQNTMTEKSVTELKAMLDAKEDFQLIDVREPHEYEICHLDAELIPMGEVADNIAKISKDKPVVIHCRSGARSGKICTI